jgi:hypothetical protein
MYKNEDLAECSVWARYIFPGLWMLADREGRLEDRPKRIKGELLPFDAQDVEPLLRELATRGFLVRYQMDGVSYIQISNFLKHQSPHYSEKKSVIKPPALPETDPHIEPSNSEKPQPIKRGPQPPDSLIPDSLIPDSLIPDSPKTTGQRVSRLAVIPEGLDPKVWQDFIAIRKAKRSPLTETALEGIRREALKAGVSLEAGLRTCCERGWQSLKAEWIGGTTEPDYSELIARLKD